MRVLHLFLSLILLTTTCFGQYLKPIRGMQFVNHTHRLARGLVFYPPMNEGSGNKVFDLSGNGNTGTLVGNTHWTSGPMGPVLSFDGVSDYVNCGDKEILSIVGPITMAAWVYPVAYGETYHAVIRKGTSVNDDTGYGFYVHSTGVVHGHGSDSKPFTSYSGITVGSWYHIVVTFDGTNMHLYVNGVFIETVANSAPNSTTAENLHIGIRGDGTSYDWNGLIDLPMIYTRTLSASEAAELYREPFGMFQQANPLMYAGTVAAPPSVVPTPYYYRGFFLLPLLPFSLIVALYSICLIREDKKCAA